MKIELKPKEKRKKEKKKRPCKENENKLDTERYKSRKVRNKYFSFFVLLTRNKT